MKIASEQLLRQLKELTQEHLNDVERLQTLSVQALNSRTSPDSWSVLECIEHLNRYGRFYLPEIEKCIRIATSPAEAVFKSGWLGNYFAHLMLPKPRLKKMKTFRAMDPINSKLDKKTLEVFVHQQYQLLDLLERSSVLSLNKVRTNISITKWIKLKLGDTFRVVIYHNERHIKQATHTYLAISSCD